MKTAAGKKTMMTTTAGKATQTRTIGCDVFKHLHCGENSKYTSQRIIQEFFKVMGKLLRESQLMELRHCDPYSIMID